MVKYYEARGLLPNPVYVFALPTHVTTLLNTGLFITRYYNTNSTVYTRLSVNRNMVKHYEALGILTTAVYVFTLKTHVTALLSTGLFITRY